MIVKTTLAISAEHANLPLDTAAVFVGSAATFSITGVPTLPAISVAAVAVSVTNAVGAVSTVAAVSGEDGWTATFPASHFAAAGTVKDGVVVAVSGTDENGAARTWTAGVGTIVILSSSPVPAPGDVVYNVRLFDEEPDAPTDGDLWPDGDGGYVIWQDGEAHALGGGTSVTVDAELSTTSENPVQNKVVTAALNGKATSAQGAKADAALSRAEAEAGFTKWTIKRNGVDVTAQVAQPTFNDAEPGWLVEDCIISSDVVEGHYAIGDASAISLSWRATNEDDSDYFAYTATRTRLPTMADIPTDNAQLINGAGYATTAAVNTALANKADASSLPYALVDVPVSSTAYAPQALFPLKFSISETPHTVAYGDSGLGVSAQGSGYWLTWSDGTDNWLIAEFAGDGSFDAEGGDIDSGMLRFGADEHAPTSADHIVLPNTAPLTDRAINAVSLSADATLVFPAQTAGKARDFVVRLTLTETGGVVPSVTFPADVAYETEGGEWPDLTEAGTYIVRLTEVPTTSASETARFFLQCSSAVADATPPSAGGGV